MRFKLKFLFVAVLLIAYNSFQSDAHIEVEQHNKTTSQSAIENFAANFHKSEALASFNLSDYPSEQRKGNSSKEVAELEEIEEENKFNSSKKYIDYVHYYSSIYYAELLYQYFQYSDNQLSLVKLCSYISPNYNYLLFQVFRI